jgi:hypothetical protein
MGILLIKEIWESDQCTGGEVLKFVDSGLKVYWKKST